MKRERVIARVVAYVWLTLYAYAMFVLRDETIIAAMGPTAAMAGGFIFGSDVIGAIKERRDGKRNNNE